MVEGEIYSSFLDTGEISIDFIVVSTVPWLPRHVYITKVWSRFAPSSQGSGRTYEK